MFTSFLLLHTKFPFWGKNCTDHPLTVIPSQEPHKHSHLCRCAKLPEQQNLKHSATSQPLQWGS